VGFLLSGTALFHPASMSYRARVSSILLLVALGCGGGGTAPSNDTEGGESTNDTGGGESSLAQSTAVGEVAPAHGATLFGVYVVVAEPGAAALEEAAAPLRARSILVSVGELGCDAGAAEALGVAPDQHAVSVMFETREAADAFAATLASPPAGIAQVTVGCAD
jgi:hypothetical protein